MGLLKVKTFLQD